MKCRLLLIARIFIVLGMLTVPGSSLSFAQGQQQGTIPNGISPTQDSMGLAIVSTDGDAYCSTLELMIADSRNSLIEGSLRCAGDTNSDFPVTSGDGLLATFTVRNNSDHPVTMNRLQVGGRGPTADTKGWDAPPTDWPTENNITLQPGKQYKYQHLHYFDTDPGTYFAEPIFQDVNGQWHSISPFPRTWFDVLPSGDSGGSTQPKTPTIQVNEIAWAPTPVAYTPATLTVRGHAAGLPSEGGPFYVNVLMETSAFSRALNYWYNTAAPAGNITPLQLKNGDFEIHISGLEMPRTVNGQISVSVVWRANPMVRGILSQKRLDVASGPEGYKACIEPLKVVLNTLADVYVPAGDAKDILQQLDNLSDYTKITGDANDSLDRCSGNAECTKQALGQWAEDLTLKKLDQAISKTSLVGAAAVTLKGLVLSAPEMINCAVFFWDEINDLVKLLNSKGKATNSVGTGSPVYPLITDSTGRRAGFLPNGQIVEEIPDSHALQFGETRIVVYTGTDSGTATIKGYANGTMHVKAVFASSAAAGGGAVALDYNNLLVSPQMVATLASTDPAGNMQMDMNGDGRPDQTKAPDVKQALGNASVPTNDSYSFKETGFSVSGRIWQLWQSGRSYDDSVYINGFPITSQRPEVSATDGKTYQTQWFERARFELHPENQPPYDVLLGLLGTSAAKGRQNESPFRPVANPGGGLVWFKETQHTLGDTSAGGRAIAAFWNRLGGLQQFGFPLSQPFVETNRADGKQYLVQYFERQRFEYHPENKGTRYEVLLGRLGAEQISQKAISPAEAISESNVGRVDLIATLNGHEGRVNSSSFSRDGSTLATVGTDHTLRFWRVSDGTLLRTVAHPAISSGVAFSPDGQTVVTGGDDQIVRLWKVTDGSLLREMSGHTKAVIKVAFSPDGSIIASGGWDQTVRLWDAGDGHFLRVLKANLGAVFSITFSPDGQSIATDNALFRVSDGALLNERVAIGQPGGYLWDLAFSPDGAFIASGSDALLFWRSNGQFISLFKGHTSGVHGVAFSPDGKVLISDSADKTIRFWRPADGTLLRTITDSSEMSGLSLSTDGKILATTSSDPAIKLWGIK